MEQSWRQFRLFYVTGKYILSCMKNSLEIGMKLVINLAMQMGWDWKLSELTAVKITLHFD